MKNTLTLILFITTLACFGTPTKVTRIIDGDTFETETGEKVRLIGINAPEISDFFGQEAKEFLADLVKNKIVELQTDNLSKNRDRYGRLLRYAIVDGIDVNKKMISDGFAFAYLKYKFSKSSQYERSQLLAREMNVGIWGSNRNTIQKHMENTKNQSFWKSIPTKAYFITFIFILLTIVGLYTFLKK